MAQEDKRKKNRIRNMILSIVIAVVAWAVVTYTTDPDITKTFTGIHVEIIGEDSLIENGYAVINREDIPNMSVKMSGKRSDLMEALDKTKVIVDVSDIKKSGEIEVEGSVKVPISRITVEKLSSQTVPINIVKLETKEVPIKIVQTGTLDGKLVKSELENKTVPVRGSKSDLKHIEEAQVKVDISKLTENSEGVYGYSLMLAKDVEKEELETLIIDDKGIKVTNTIYEEKEIPIKIVPKTEDSFVLDKERTNSEPKTVKVGLSKGVVIEYIEIIIEEESGEGEYTIEQTDGMYIPENRRAITIKPVWEKIN